MRLKDKVAIVTGAGSGIGRASALLFAREGAKVVVATRTAKHGEETADLITRDGGQAVFVKVDVSKGAEVKAMLEAAIDEYGKLDILFANAGWEGPLVPAADISEEDWDEVIDVNLKGIYLCCKYAIPEMLKNGGGAIVCNSSCCAVGAEPNEAAYLASKGGVNMLAKGFAIDYARKNIRVNCILPGPIETPMVTRLARLKDVATQAFAEHIPMGRCGTPEEVAYGALFLASDEASHVTGACLAIDGGRTAQLY